MIDYEMVEMASMCNRIEAEIASLYFWGAMKWCDDHFDNAGEKIIVRVNVALFDGSNSKAARKFPQPLHAIAFRKLDMINVAKQLDDLKVPPLGIDYRL